MKTARRSAFATAFRTATVGAAIGCCIGTASATDATFRVVDQNGDLIPASYVFILEAGQTVPNDGTVALDPGSYTVAASPGLNGGSGGCCLYRNESIEVSGPSQTLVFVWKTALLTATLMDQASVPIPGALIEVRSDPGNVLITTLANGASVRLPVTDDPSSAPIQGALANGYNLSSVPAINGASIGCCLFRFEPTPIELVETGTSVSYQWKMADLQLSLVDENSTPIPGAQTEVLSSNNFFGRVANGASIHVPVTEDPSSAPIHGELVDGYELLSIPTINGVPIGCCLFRREPAKVTVPEQGASVTHVWSYANLTARLDDQDGILIPGATIEVHSSPAGNVSRTFFTTLSNGSSARLPVTEDPDGLPLSGETATGYGFDSIPAINGASIGCCLYRRETISTELTTSGASQTLVWDYAKGPLHVVDASEAEVSGASFQFGSFIPDSPTGTIVSLPVNDTAFYPTLGGTFAGAYPFELRLRAPNPQSGPFSFVIQPGEAVNPPFVSIAGAHFGLRFHLLSGVDPGRVPPTVTLGKAFPSGIQIIWSRSTCMGAQDYGIYQGVLGNWYSHVAIDCHDVGGDLSETLPIPEGDVYFLVVPFNDGGEGSYGLDSSSTERPPSSTVSCQPWQTLGCP